MSNLKRNKAIFTIAINHFIQFFLLATMVCQSSYAKVTLTKKAEPPTNKLVVKEKIKPKYTIKQYKKRQYNVEGYVDSSYVRFVVELTANNLITGQIIQPNGINRAVSGELINGVFHLYDSEGEHFTVIPSK